MQLILYASKNNQYEEKLEAAVISAAPGMAIERFSRLDDLRERLRNIVEPNSIAVLMAGDREEIQNLQAFRDMLIEIYIILVLPDRQADTINLAHQLRPRFLSSVKDDFTALKLIIRKIIQSPHSPPTPPLAAGSLKKQIEIESGTY
jgi:hypothetical protein